MKARGKNLDLDIMDKLFNLSPPWTMWFFIFCFLESLISILRFRI